MNLVTFGSTGGTGIETVRQALARGHRVRAFARDPGRLPVAHERLDLVQGDVLDPHAVAQAVAGADAAISALEVRLGQPVGTVRSEGTRHIVAALINAGVKRFVSISTVGVGDSRERQSSLGRMLLPRLIGQARLDEAAAQEASIRASTLWTLLRPPRLTNGAATGRYRIGRERHTGLTSRISRADLATALLDQLDTEEFIESSQALQSRSTSRAWSHCLPYPHGRGLVAKADDCRYEAKAAGRNCTVCRELDAV